MTKEMPAFPTTLYDYGGETDGMSLRDYFAAKAMQGIMTDPNLSMSRDEVAEWAYRQADAMLKARDQ